MAGRAFVHLFFFGSARSVLARLLFLFGFLVYQTPVSEAQASDLAAAIVELIGSAFPPSFQPSDNIAENRYYAAMDPAIVVPNNAPKSVAFVEMLQSFDNIPHSAGSVNFSSVNELTLTSVFGRLSKDLEIGTSELSAEQQELVTEANELLYKDENTQEPTEGYSSYIDYKFRHTEALQKYHSETNNAAKISLQAELIQIERDWSLFGMRETIDQALQVLATYSGGSSAALAEQWVELADGYTPPRFDFFERFGASGDWSRVSLTSDDFDEGRVEIIIDGDVADLPPIVRISFDVAFINIDRQPISHPFLSSSHWRTQSGLVLSEGSEIIDLEKEILPRYISGVIVVKGIEIGFESGIEESVLDEISTGQSVFLGNIEIVAPGSATPAVQRKWISVSSPILLGAIVSRTKKIPHPSVGLSWKVFGEK